MIKGIDYIGVNVVFYCYDKKGRILLNKRSNKCRDEVGRWDAGGGAMNFGETFEEAVRREIKEEYCVDVKELTYISTQNVIREHKGKKTHWVAILFAALINPKDVRIGDTEKIDGVDWFDPDKLPKPMHSMFETLFELVKKHGIFR